MLVVIATLVQACICILTKICRSMHVDIEVINRNGLSTITVDFLIETVL